MGAFDGGLAPEEQRRLVVVLREALGLAADLIDGIVVFCDGLGERYETLRPRLKRAAAAEGVRLVGHPAARARLPMHPVALIVVDCGQRRVDRDLMKVRAPEPG